MSTRDRTDVETASRGPIGLHEQYRIGSAPATGAELR